MIQSACSFIYIRIISNFTAIIVNSNLDIRNRAQSLILKARIVMHRKFRLFKNLRQIGIISMLIIILKYLNEWDWRFYLSFSYFTSYQRHWVKKLYVWTKRNKKWTWLATLNRWKEKHKKFKKLVRQVLSKIKRNSNFEKKNWFSIWTKIFESK